MYEYAVVQLPSVLKPNREIEWTEHINAVAAEGWRLVSLQSQDFSTGWTSGVATFERELPVMSEQPSPIERSWDA